MTAKLEVTINDWNDGDVIPDKHAFCIPAEENHVTLGENISPAISWSGAPDGTASYAIVCHDPDVPQDLSTLNNEESSIPVDAPRFTLYHWVLADIPGSITSLGEGAESQGIQPGGKDAGKTDHGVRGLNGYTEWFAADEKMKGNYGGYDGPCPPWNDDKLHHYHFTVYALDIINLDLGDNFKGPELESAMQGHILAKGEYVGTYSLNPKLR